MCWTPLSAHKHKDDNIGYRRQRKITTKNKNRTQYVLDTTIRTQTQSRQHSVQKTKRKKQQKTKTEHNMCWTPLSAHKHKADNIVYRRQREKTKTEHKNRTQYVLDTTIRTQTQNNPG